MDETQRSSEADCFAVHGPHWLKLSAEAYPPGFFALRLVLQPSGTVIELARPDMLVGRHSVADVRLPLPDVSRRHCRFLFHDGNWRVVDLSSLNGLWLNNTQIQQAALKQGDVLGIGGFSFLVDLSAGQADPMTEVEPESGLRRAIFQAIPRPDAGAIERRRAS